MGTKIQTSGRALQYYAVVQLWLLDIGYFKIEVRYLFSQFEGYHLRFSSSNNQQKLKSMERDLSILENYISKFYLLLQDRENDLILIIEDQMDENIDMQAHRQIRLENLMRGLVAEYQSFKKTFFAFAEEIDNPVELLSFENGQALQVKKRDVFRSA